MLVAALFLASAACSTANSNPLSGSSGSSSPPGGAAGANSSSPACLLDFNQLKAITGQDWRILYATPTDPAGPTGTLGSCFYTTGGSDTSKVVNLALFKNLGGRGPTDSDIMKGIVFSGQGKQITRMGDTAHRTFICRETIQGRKTVEALYLGPTRHLTFVAPNGPPTGVTDDELTEIAVAVASRADL